ncbi:UNVERIFIED_ORG: hypothetical protein ABIC54_004234 [Burkholderia sp. 1263]
MLSANNSRATASFGSLTIEEIESRTRCFVGNESKTSSSGLQDALDRVVDERSFIDFLHALAGDWTAATDSDPAHPLLQHSNRASKWENGSIAAFFDAAASWGDASKSGLRFYNVPTNPWRRVADILCAGKEYE